MTRDELIKQLRTCAGREGTCRDCPLVDEKWCSDNLKLEAAEMLQAYSQLDAIGDANTYQMAAMRTANEQCLNLANAGLGLTGEAGEAADLIKKHLFHGHELDKEALVKELGDVLWYVALAADLIGVKLADIMLLNVAKLRARYPEGFSEERSRNRDE